MNIYRDVFEQLVKPAIEAEQPDVIGISIVLQQQMFSSMTFARSSSSTSPHSCDDRRQHGHAFARRAPAVAVVSVLRQCRGL